MSIFKNSTADANFEDDNKSISVRQALLASGVLNTMPKKSLMDRLRSFFGIEEVSPRIDFSRFMSNELSSERFDNSDIPSPAAIVAEPKPKWTGSSWSPTKVIQAGPSAPTPAEVRRHIDPDAGIGANIAAGLGLAELRQKVVGNPPKKWARPAAKRNSDSNTRKSPSTSLDRNESWKLDYASTIGSMAVAGAGMSALNASFAAPDASSVHMEFNQPTHPQVNPSTGLPMVNEAFDVSGTPFGGIDINSTTDSIGISDSFSSFSSSGSFSSFGSSDSFGSFS